MTKRIVRAALAAVVLTVLLASCQDVTEGGGHRCSVKANSPHESNGTSGWIVAKAQMKCNPQVSYHYYLRLEKKQGSGSWAAVDTRDDVISSGISTTQQTRQTQIECANGTYRFRAKVNFTSGGVTYYGEWSYSPTVLNPCGTSGGGGGGGGGGGSW